MSVEEKKAYRKALRNAAYFVAYVFAFLFLWWLAARVMGNECVFPSVKETLKETGRLLREKRFYEGFLSSFLRTLKVFFSSFVCAVIFAIVAYLYPVFFKIFTPVIAIIRALPTMAVLLIILLRTSPSTAPVVVGFLALFPMLYTGVYNALSNVDVKLVQMCKAYKIPVWKRIWKLYLPLSASSILRESAAGLSFGIKLVVSAEIMASTDGGLGNLLQESKLYYSTAARLFALTLLIVLTGLILEFIGAWIADKRRVQ